MKILITLFMMFQMSLFAQESIPVKGSVVDLGMVRETLGSSVKRVILELNEQTSQEFKVKFAYSYQFVSHEIDTVILNSNGVGGYTTRRRVEDYTGKQTLRFDISESSIVRGEKIQVLLEISKPNKNTHSILVEAKLIGNNTNFLDGGRKLFGLLGRSYTIRENCQ